MSVHLKKTLDMKWHSPKLLQRKQIVPVGRGGSWVSSWRLGAGQHGRRQPSQKPQHLEHYTSFMSPLFQLPFPIFFLTYLCSLLLRSWGLGGFFVVFVSARHTESLILIRPSRHSYTNNCILPAIRNVLFEIKTSYHAWMRVWNSLILLSNMENFTGHTNVTEIPHVQGGARTLLTDFPFSLCIILLSMSPRQFSFSQERFCHSNTPMGLDAIWID